MLSCGGVMVVMRLCCQAGFWRVAVPCKCQLCLADCSIIRLCVILGW